MFFAQPINKMDLRPDSELRARRRRGDDAADLVGGADGVRFLADLPAALGMHHHFDPGIPRAHLVHMLRQKALVDGAVSLPKNDLRFPETLRRVPAHQLERVPNRHLVQGYTHRKRGIAPEVLVGQKEDLLGLSKSPAKSSRS